MNIVSMVIAWLVTSVSFFIISKLPIGVDIDSFGTAMISAAVFGLLNVFMQLIMGLTLPLQLIPLINLFMIVINAAILGFATWLVKGFRLRWGIWSAMLGAIALSFINSWLHQVLGPLNSLR